MDHETFVAKEVLTPDDLSQLLGISVWTVYAATSPRNRDHVKFELPPFFKIGKLIRWHREDVLKWLHQQKKVCPSRGSK